MKESSTLAIVGLGYVGLPLAHAFAKKGYRIIGYDISQRRIEELQKNIDSTDELSGDQLKEVSIEFTTDPIILKEADVIILAIPTPVDEANRPDLTLIEKASETIGANLKSGTIVVYESTVYPGTTEEICGPILEKASGLTCGKDFFLGYSPERINPGDKEHTVDKIIKVVAGQDEQTTDTLCELYGSVVTAGIHRAESIKVAEMAKAIENAQRDLNIAFVNEVALLSNKIGIPTKAVLEAAGTKWNFLKFSPGLVGGHCIGVDPYYLVEKAKQLGMDTHVITAGRVVNDSMGKHVAEQILKHTGTDAAVRVLLLGITFKENVPDMRNSKVRDVQTALQGTGVQVFAHDPLYSPGELQQFGYESATLADGPFDAVALLVPHTEYANMPIETFTKAMKEGGLFYDLKSFLSGTKIKEAGHNYQAL